MSGRTANRAASRAALLVGLTVGLGGAAPLRAQQEPVHPPAAGLDQQRRLFLLGDLLEYQPGGNTKAFNFDAMGWYGGDVNRLWLRAEGNQTLGDPSGDVRVTAQYGRLVSPFFDAVAGLAFDTRATAGEPGRSGRRVTRGMVAVGLQGLAPYYIEFEPTLYVSQRGDISARFTGSYRVLFTQRLILQPRLEANAAVQRVPEFGTGSGLNDVEFGLRLRYEFQRQVGPYVGVSWTRLTGGTAAMARSAGESVGPRTIVAGVRLWR